MYLAVLLYRSVVNAPPGIPGVWPAEVIELGDVGSLPDNLSADDGWIVMYHDDYVSYRAQYQSTFDTWYAQYTAPTPQQIVGAKIISAKEFGEILLNEIATDNVLAGVSTQDVQSLIINNLGLILMLKSGSLYTALATVSSYVPDTVMTQSRLNKYIAQLKTYLGIP
jgi:hypothetical protein